MCPLKPTWSFHKKHHNLSYPPSISSKAACLFHAKGSGPGLFLHVNGSLKLFLLYELLEASDPSFQNSKMSSALEEGRVLTALTSLFYKLPSIKQIFTQFSMSPQIGDKRDPDRGGWIKAGLLIATRGPLVFLMKTSEGLRQPCT